MSDRPARYLLALLFDPSERESFAADRDAAMASWGLSPAQALAFRAIDLDGLQADAEGRARYLMSAVCRAYPLSAGAIGSSTDGAEALAAFLASPALLAGAAARNAAFGEHLARLLSLDAAGLGAAVTAFLRPFLDLERGLVDNAARVRQAAAQGQAPPPPRAGTPAERRRRPLRLPPALLAVQLPTSPEVLRAALLGLRAEDAWQRIRGRDLSVSRVVAVARATPQPVLMLARAVVGDAVGDTAALAAADAAVDPAAGRGAPGAIAPLVEVSHRTAELPPEASALLRLCDGSRRLSDLGPRQQVLAGALLDAGLLDLGPAPG